MGHQWWEKRLYFSFHPKCSKLCPLLQRDANDKEMQEKFLSARLAIKSLATDSVADPRHFGVDPDPEPDPRIHASDKWIRTRIWMRIWILLFSF